MNYLVLNNSCLQTLHSPHSEFYIFAHKKSTLFFSRKTVQLPPNTNTFIAFYYFYIKMTTIEEVKQLIASRHSSTKLYGLEDIPRERTWNYELPTFTAGKRFLDRHHDWSDEDFSTAFYEKFPLLKSVDTSDLAVIGGCVFDFLTKRQNSIKDIDIFVIGEKYVDKNNFLKEQRSFLTTSGKSSWQRTENMRRTRENVVTHTASKNRSIIFLISKPHVMVVFYQYLSQP